MAAEDPISSRSPIPLFATGEPRRGLFRLFPPAARVELWAGLAFLVLSLLGAAWVIKCRSDALALEQDSVNVEGEVVRLWTTKENNGWRYRVEYEYAAPPPGDPHLFRDKTELPKPDFERLKEGGPITVKVCRTDSANHQVVGERPRAVLNTAVLLSSLGHLALLALAGAVSLWWWWSSLRKPGPAQLLILGRTDG